MKIIFNEKLAVMIVVEVAKLSLNCRKSEEEEASKNKRGGRSQSVCNHQISSMKSATRMFFTWKVSFREKLFSSAFIFSFGEKIISRHVLGG